MDTTIIKGLHRDYREYFRRKGSRFQDLGFPGFR